MIGSTHHNHRLFVEVDIPKSLFTPDRRTDESHINGSGQKNLVQLGARQVSKNNLKFWCLTLIFSKEPGQRLRADGAHEADM